MLLTRASEYALLSLDKIRRSENPVGSEQLAKELCIPKSFLAKILHNLAKQEILVSHRGAHGGFTIKEDLAKISVYRVILAAEGRTPSVFDCTQYSDTCPNGAIGNCAISPFLARFQGKIDRFLHELTLDQLFDEQ
ncbi:RrF2 family transcriptional regulator [Nitratifractor sp.]